MNRAAAPAVVDASVFLDALTPCARRQAARRALEAVEPIAPASVDVEVLSALARLERSGQLATREADAAIASWVEADIERVEIRAVVPEAWAMRAAVRPADGLYVALAGGLALPLVTSDARLARAPIRGVTFTVVT
ncbi:MAG: type II toxin-antitoxin system VapC family toxin [Microbacteriaceae bacterium]